MTKETIDNLYIYIVLVITLIISIVGLARVVDTSLALLVDTSYRSSYSDFAIQLRNECANNQPIMIKGSMPMPPETLNPSGVGPMNYSRLTQKECAELETNSETVAVKRLFEEQNEVQHQNEQRNKLAQLLRAFPWFIVPLPFFFMFNKMRKEKK